MVGLSKKTDYALQFLVACGESTGQLSVGAFSRDSHISFLFMQQIVSELKKAEMVTVTKGCEGGYALAKPLSEISIQEVAEIMEGKTAMLPCMVSTAKCSLSETCGSRKRFSKINQKLIDVLSGIKLNEIA